MSSNNTTTTTCTPYYEKMMSKKCCGIRLNSRRFSVQRLRTNFFYLCRLFRRWKNSCRSCLRLMRRRRGNKDYCVERPINEGHGYSSSSSSTFCAVRTMGHSNSFCSEAIADCLEFIKRNSVSIDDETNPMLKME